jgi:carbon storage regulator
MLVLSRKKNEKIMIGDDIVLTILKISGSKISIGVEAPKEITIRRGELPDNKVREILTLNEEN